MEKTVFHVSRATKTGKTVHVGNFDTEAQALSAMLAHFKAAPKRGKFCYSISKDVLREIGGVMFRETCIVGGTYYKKFMPDELRKLAENEGR